MVLLHGWGMHGGVWKEVVDDLAKTYRVHCVDLPGHGYSPLNLSEFTLHGVSQEIISALSKYLKQGADFIGWSLGGMVSLQIALREPELVNKLILVTATPRFILDEDWPCGMAEEVLQGFATDLQTDHQATIEQFLALQTLGSRNGRDCMRQLRERVFSRNIPDPLALAGGLDILCQADLRTSLHKIKQPTLLIGGKLDRLVPPTAITKTANMLPHAEAIIIDGSGHAPFISHRDEFMRSVKRFIVANE